MGGSAAPYNASGPVGVPYGIGFGGQAGVSEQQDFEVANIIKVSDFTHPTTGPTYGSVNSVVQYKSVNPTNGIAKRIKLYVNETRTTIRNAANA